MPRFKVAITHVLTTWHDAPQRDGHSRDVELVRAIAMQCSTDREVVEADVAELVRAAGPVVKVTWMGMICSLE